jgi:DNA-directed RNA polymerase alpha subunit
LRAKKEEKENAKYSTSSTKSSYRVEGKSFADLFGKKQNEQPAEVNDIKKTLLEIVQKLDELGKRVNDNSTDIKTFKDIFNNLK